MSVSLWQDKTSSLKMTKEFDIAVIGAGIAGHSLCYWLEKEMPGSKIALIEKAEIGDGATGRNAGFVTCGSVEHFNRLVETHGEEVALEMWQFSERNLELLKTEIIDDHGLVDFEERGSFSLASTEIEFKELKKSAELMKKLGIAVEILSREEVEERTGAQGFVGGVKYIEDGSIHPLKLLSCIRKKFQNVEIFENCEVIEVDKESDLRILRTKKGTFSVQAVVFATNGYSPLLSPYFQDKITPTRGQILAVEKTEHFMEAPCYANFVLDYFRQLPSGEFLIGGFRQLQKDKELGYSDETNPLIQKALEEFIDKHLPQLRGKKITHRWSGIMGFSQDGQPLVGSLPDDPQVYFLGGFTAHGLGLAFHGAKVLVDAMLGKNIPYWLSAKRF